MKAALNELAINNRVGELDERTISIERPQTQSRRSSLQPRLRIVPSTGFGQATTFEQGSSNPFGQRRESSGSRRSTETAMTLPYLTFQPMIGRNSVCYILLLANNSYSSA
jgi:hypothetical protein